MSGYGPQENHPEVQRTAFYTTLDAEVERSYLAGREVIISMDANAKLGNKWIPKDKHSICENGKLLEKVLIKHALVVANGHVKCQVSITRKIVTTNRTEESTIDLVIMSEDLANNIINVYVDEDKKNMLLQESQRLKQE